MTQYLKSLYRYRHFILGCVKRDIQARYKRSLLGSLWLVIQPLMLILMYTVVFSSVMETRLGGRGGGYSYSVYLCAGMLPWLFLSEVISRAQVVFLENSNLLRKMSLPKSALFLGVGGVAIVNFISTISLFCLVLAVTGKFPGLNVIIVIPLAVLQLVFSLSLGAMLACLNVFFRDVGHLVGVGLQLWFWATPIVYTVDVLPDFVRKFFFLNPMTQIVVWSQSIFLGNPLPNLITLLPTASLSIGFFILAVLMSVRLDRDILDEI